MMGRDTGAWTRASIQRDRARLERQMRARERAIAPVEVEKLTTCSCWNCGYRRPISDDPCVTCKEPSTENQ